MRFSNLALKRCRNCRLVKKRLTANYLNIERTCKIFNLTNLENWYIGRGGGGVLSFRGDLAKATSIVHSCCPRHEAMTRTPKTNATFINCARVQDNKKAGLINEKKICYIRNVCRKVNLYILWLVLTNTISKQQMYICCFQTDRPV